MVNRFTVCDKCIKVCHRLHKDSFPIIARFFKFVMPRAISSTNSAEILYLPPKFVREANLTTEQKTEIEDSDGSRWSVMISNDSGSMAFTDGWCEFYRDHGLEEGHLLVFNYIKGSHFIVQIFQRSACEILNFDKVRKRSRRNSGCERDELSKKRNASSPVTPRSEVEKIMDGPSLMINKDESFSHSSKKRRASSPVTPRSEAQYVEKIEDDPSLMINRDDSYYRGEDRNFLYDLSSFETAKKKQNPTTNAHYGDVLASKFDTNSKDDTQDVVIDTNPTTKMEANQTNQPNGDTFASKFDTKPTNISIVSKGDCKNPVVASDSQSLFSIKNPFQHISFESVYSNRAIKKEPVDLKVEAETSPSHGKKPVLASDRQSPFMASSKIAECISTVKHMSFESLLGNRAVKKELVDVKEEPKDFHDVSDDEGNEPALARYDTSLPGVVKQEPDLPSVESDPFPVEVKSQSYLEVDIPPMRRRRGRRVFYVKDPNRRLWPLLYLDDLYLNFKASTGTWKMFCQHNDVKPGDKCWFQLEKDCVYRYTGKVDGDCRN